MRATLISVHVPRDVPGQGTPTQSDETPVACHKVLFLKVLEAHSWTQGPVDFWVDVDLLQPGGAHCFVGRQSEEPQAGEELVVGGRASRHATLVQAPFSFDQW